MSSYSRQQIEKVLRENTDYDFLTLDFIVQKTGLDKEKVCHILETEEKLARKPYGQEHLNIFTRYDKPIKMRERASLFLRYINKQ